MEQQGKAQTEAATVVLANLAEAITKATLRALEERQLVPSSAAALPSGKVGIPVGDGGTVLGIVIPPWERGHGVGGLGPCGHPMIFGIIIMHKNFIPREVPGGSTQGLS